MRIQNHVVSNYGTVHWGRSFQVPQSPKMTALKLYDNTNTGTSGTGISTLLEEDSVNNGYAICPKFYINYANYGRLQV